MKSLKSRRLAIIVWLTLFSWLPYEAMATVSKEITSYEQLKEALSSSGLRSGEVKDLNITPQGITIESLAKVAPGSYRMHGGPLIRTDKYIGTALQISDDVNFTMQNTIEGSNIPVKDVTVIVDKGGTLTMDKKATIQNVQNTDNKSAVLWNQGRFELYGSIMASNNIYTVLNQGSLLAKDGTIAHKSVAGHYSVGNVNASISLWGGANINSIYVTHLGPELPIPIIIQSALQQNITFVSEEICENGDIIAEGTSTYTLQQSDMNKIKINVNTNLNEKLENNKIILYTPSPVIDTAEKLQKAINESQGTEQNPAVITISEKGLSLTQTITITEKYVKLTGGTIWAGYTTSPTLTMFTVNSGKLILENIILDGSGSPSTPYTECCFIEQVGGVCVISTKAILQKASGFRGRSPISVFAGSFYLSGGTISKNTSSTGTVVHIGSKASFTMDAGDILDNNTGHACTLLIDGLFTFKGGNITHNNYGSNIRIGSIGVMYYQTQDKYHSIDSFSIIKGGYIVLNANLQIKIRITELDDAITDGYVLAKGDGNYQITANDLANFVMPEGYSLKLVGNTLVVVKESDLIDTQDKLQAAIDASKGTLNAPTEIKIANKEIAITHALMIQSKFVKLTGGVLKNMASGDLRMFDVRSGYLALTAITLNGNQQSHSGYCTLIEMNGGTCDIMEGAKLTNTIARGGVQSVIAIPNGILNFKAGDIIGNTSEGGDIVWVSSNGKFNMQGGQLLKNTNSGRYIMSQITMTSGEMLLNGGQISDNSGSRYGVFATESFSMGGNINLKETAILYNNSKILITSALKNPITIGYTKNNLPSGTIVATGKGYQVTSADAQKFSYRYANTYRFNLEGNNIVLYNLDAVNKAFKIITVQSSNGSLSPDKASAKENEQILVTIAPKKGWNLIPGTLRYNNCRLLQTDKSDIYGFKMPPLDVKVTAEFTPDNITVTPKPNPDESEGGPIITGWGPFLNGISGNNPTNISEGGKGPMTKSELPPDLGGTITTGEGYGDNYITSFEEFISLTAIGPDGKPLRTKVLKNLPGEITLCVYLPPRLIISEQLRANGTAMYYVLNECEGKITRINPTYDYEENTLTFKTNKLGHFAVMNGSSSTANETIQTSTVTVYIDGDRLSIRGLQPGETYSVYDASGKQIKQEVASDEISHFYPETTGVYIFTFNSGSQKVYFEK